ncbi:MAG: GntR family transcriptional regulator [Leptolinea sp.]
MNSSIPKIVAGSMPKYRQLLIIIRNKILNGQIMPGERIPSEEELITITGLSRGTVRKAISQLEAERLIETEHGIGSFVRALHPNSVPFHFLAPSQIVETAAGNASYEIVTQETIPAPLDIAEKLKLPIGAMVIHIARRKKVNSETVSYSERFLQEDILPSLLSEDLTKIGSIHELLVGESEYPLLRAEIEIEAHLINAEEAHQLKALEGDSAIVVHRMTYTAPNRPAVWYYGLFKSQYFIGVGVH